MTDPARDEGYIRAWDVDFVFIDGLSEKPEDAPGDPADPLLFCKRITPEDLAEAFEGHALVERIEEYAYDNGLLGDGDLDDFYDIVDGFADKLESAIRNAVVEGITASRYFHVERIKE